MPFKGFALLKDKLLVADAGRMEVASFIVPEEETSKIMNELAVGDRGSLNLLGRPQESQKFNDEQELIRGYGQAIQTWGQNGGIGTHIGGSSTLGQNQSHERAGARVT